MQSNRFVSDLATCFKGLGREVTRREGKGKANIKRGKDPLEFSLYCVLGKKLMQTAEGTKDRAHVFAHTFSLLCWNLMCRSANAVSLCLPHLEWQEDALGIYFAHMKNDQSGTRPRDARHVYANPIRPEICPILSLGIYFLCHPTIFQQRRLFPGGSQYDRYGVILKQLFEPQSSSGADGDIDSVADGEHQSSEDSSVDIGSHSFRKGAATYSSSGSTACPSSAAIHLRAGWSMGGVQNTYLRFFLFILSVLYDKL